MNIIAAIRNEARMIWSLADDGMKAAIRTAYQNIQAAIAIALFAVASSVVAWASGGGGGGGGGGGVAALAAIASLKAYYMNRGDKGARYD